MYRACLAAGLIAAALGCGNDRRYGPNDNPTALRDATGVAFGWSCDGQGCVVTQLAATPAPNPCPNPNASAYSFSWGRFVEICSVCLADEPGFYWSTTPGECRIVACDADADCPALYESGPGDGYDCVNDLCQNVDTVRFPRGTLRRIEVEQLCFAVHPRTDTASPSSPTTQDVVDAVEAACPDALPTDPCTLPAGCLTP